MFQIVNSGAGRLGCARSAGAALLLMSAVGAATAQLNSADLAALRARGQREGWTFTVGENSATCRAPGELCGLREPPNWRAAAVFDSSPPRRSLPSAWDWRAVGGCTPVRCQPCGNCWAFATVGPLECNVLIKDGISVDLSEQWLVSCNQEGWGCGGGWFAHPYHESAVDPCGQSGAVFEADFPNVGLDAPCNCPYRHQYFIESWAYVGGWEGEDTNAIKQAILDYGPVSAGVYASFAFMGYTGGIFNDCEYGEINHGVVLVGWDDAQGVWILRNSWGPGWGEEGYMRIVYGCCRVGFGACYVNYQMRDCNGNAVPDLCDVSCADACAVPDCGGSTDCNGNLVPDECEDDCNTNGIPDDCDIAAGVSADCNTNGRPDECEPDCNGNGVPDDCDLAMGVSEDCNLNGVPDECDIAVGLATDCNGNGVPDQCDLLPPLHVPARDDCAEAELLRVGASQVGTTVGATPDGSASCGASGGAPDVWYYYQPSGNGYLAVSLCGSEFDTVVSVHSGCPGSPENQVACNDDYCGLQSGLTMFVRAGREYWIRVAGAHGAAGHFKLLLSGPACVYEAECNDNGIPDDCEADCNGNGRPDDCDIASSISGDVDGDGVPDECQRRGDLNCDGAVNTFDVDPFVLALTDPAAYARTYPGCNYLFADMNCDNLVNVFDIDLFVRGLISGGCAPCP